MPKIDLSKFTAVEPKRPSAWGREAGPPRVALSKKPDKDGKVSSRLMISAEARRMAGFEIGDKLEFLKCDSVVAVRKSAGGLKLCQSSVVFINRVIDGLGIEEGVYPVWAEGGVLFFDLDDKDQGESSVSELAESGGVVEEEFEDDMRQSVKGEEFVEDGGVVVDEETGWGESFPEEDGDEEL